MIQFDDVSLAFSGEPLFEHASFTIQKGDRCGLVGRNGSGKSTLFRLIVGELDTDGGNISISKNYRIGYLHQNIRFTEPTVLAEAALGLPEGEKDHLYKAEKILFGLGFSEDDLEAPPSSFSGGFQLRLHLAKVLIAEPDCLLLDEPTNYLDLPSIRWLMHFLSRWKGAFILISHDRDFMDKVTTHTMGIHREAVIKIRGSSLDFFKQILEKEELHEKSRVKVEKKKAHMQSFVERFGAKASKAAQARSKQKMLDREPVLEELNLLSSLSFSFNEAPFPGKKMVDMEHVQFSFTEDPLIQDVSLEIEKGERVAIIGKNGRGKSTLLRLIGSDLTSKQGTVHFSENTRIGYFGQTHVDRLNSAHSIEQEIATANPALTYTQVKAICGLMMFGGTLSEKKISVLSGGEKSRVLLGKIVAKPCNILLLDEPTHHLDIESIEALIDALEDFSGAVVIVTHSELILRRLDVDKIILCTSAQQTTFLGNYDEFLEKIGWEDENKGSRLKKNQPGRPHSESPAKKTALCAPLRKQIQEKEAQVMSLEAQQKNDQAILEKGEVSPALLKEMGLRQKQLELLEAELYSLYELYESKQQETEI